MYMKEQGVVNRHESPPPNNNSFNTSSEFSVSYLTLLGNVQYPKFWLEVVHCENIVCQLTHLEIIIEENQSIMRLDANARSKCTAQHSPSNDKITHLITHSQLSSSLIPMTAR